MKVCRIVTSFDGDHCLLWWWRTTDGNVQRKGALCHSQAEPPLGCLHVYVHINMCVYGESQRECTTLIREDYHVWEHTSWFSLVSQVHIIEWLISPVVYRQVCKCDHMSSFILIDWENWSQCLKCETNSTLVRWRGGGAPALPMTKRQAALHNEVQIQVKQPKEKKSLLKSYF